MNRRLQWWFAWWTLAVIMAPPLAAIPYDQLRGAPKVCAMACSLDEGPCCCELLGIESYDVDVDPDHAASEHAERDGAPQWHRDLGLPFLDGPAGSCGPETCQGAFVHGSSQPLPLPFSVTGPRSSLVSETFVAPFAPGTVVDAPDSRATAPRGPPRRS